jgi:hypothetical protein
VSWLKFWIKMGVMASEDMAKMMIGENQDGDDVKFTL